MNMRPFILATFLTGIVILGCSDGKFNLVLYVPEWWDSEDEQVEIETKSSSSTAQNIPGSSGEEYSSSSNGQAPATSSSSSSRDNVRLSSAKVNRDGLVYEDYPMLERGSEGVKYGWATRYWDGCKPHCSGLEHIGNPKPWAINKVCDISGINEISIYEVETWNPPWYIGYNGIKSSCEPQDTVPGKPLLPVSYTCFDMTPYAVNDTLAYGFAARNSSVAKCGACYQLEFDGYWYDENNEGNEQPRPTHRALRGKKMIVMVNNIGAPGLDQFDIMIPGGGTGDFDSFSKQLGIDKKDFGVEFGGLLSNCLEGKNGGILREWGIPDGSHRATLEEWQRCLRQECDRIFSDKNKMLLNGCYWQVDWFMAADNPTLYYKEVECPTYLKNKYRSSIDIAPPPLPDDYTGPCLIQGNDCKQTGWYD